MIICPYCDAENIEGADVCEQCEQPLADLHLPVPATNVERALLRDRVRTLGPHPAIVVPADASIPSVLKTMADEEIGCVFVVDAEDRERPIGVFTERDALLRLNPDEDYGHTPISTVMTPNPQSLAETAKVAFAAQRMDQGGYRHIPVVDAEGRMTGVISARDILTYLTKRIAR